MYPRMLCLLQLLLYLGKDKTTILSDSSRLNVKIQTLHNIIILTRGFLLVFIIHGIHVKPKLEIQFLCRYNAHKTANKCVMLTLNQFISILINSPFSPLCGDL